MNTVTTKELGKLLAGGDSYIRTKNGEVKGLAINFDKNPDAPEIIVIGDGPIIIKNAQLLLASNKYVPLYIKQKVNSWNYVGLFRAKEIKTDLASINRYRKHRDKDHIYGILFLEKE